MAPGYDYNSALRRRLASIDDLGTSQNNFAQMMASRARAKAQAEQQMSLLQAQYDSAMVGQQNAAGIPGGMSSGNSSFDKFKNAIAQIESGGNYNARNPSGALGKYQIMSGNVASWSKQALGHSVSIQQFMAPDIQEKVATYQLRRLYDRFGPAGAAVAWYAGEGTAQRWMAAGGGSGYNRTQAGGYPSINAYVQKLQRYMG
jgi:hypothetical protein